MVSTQILLLGLVCCCGLTLPRVSSHTHPHSGHQMSSDSGMQAEKQVPHDHEMHHEASGHEYHQETAASFEPGEVPLIVTIFDGLRHDYLEVYKSRGLNLPNFEALLKHGVHANNVRPVFPTITMPNHQSLMTGLYPESHGILSNTFTDTALPGRVFSMENQTELNDPMWYSGWPEPLWVTNQRQGGKSAVVLYPNSDIEYNGARPYLQIDQYITLNGKSAIYPYELRVDRLLHWLANPTLYGKLNLALLYFDEPDATGHIHGPVSNAMGNRLVQMDQMLGRLLAGLTQLKMLDAVNLIVTADHGMASVDPQNVTDLSSIAGFYENRLGTQISSEVSLWPAAGKTVAELVGKLSSLPGIHAYESSKLPAELRLAACSRRLPPVLVWAQSHGIIRLNASLPIPLGTHGYSANDPDMRPIWLARGPAFRKGATVADAIESVDLYPLACYLLGLQPNANNGSLDRIAGVLKTKPVSSPIYQSRGGFLATFAGLFILFAFFGTLLLATAAFTGAKKTTRTVRGELG